VDDRRGSGKTPIELGIAGVRAWRRDGAERTGAGSYVLVQAEQPLKTLNSAPWGGGFGFHRLLVNRQVDKSYDCDDPIAEMAAFLGEEGLAAAEAACLLTAASVADAGISHAVYGAARVTSLVTVGLGNKARAGLAQPAPLLYPGTINVIVLVDGTMTDAAMVNAVVTATEAKAAVLQELDERVDGARPEAGAAGFLSPAAAPHATGTTTDAVLIASTQRGPVHRYAGTATEVGHLIGRTVYEAAMEAGRRWQAYVRERTDKRQDLR
jgi:adenosylcobinamide amidohydrolase